MPELYLGWQTDPVLLGSLLTLAVVYGLAAGPLRARLAPGAPFPRRAAAGFYGTIAVLYLFEGSPLHDLAERYSLTMHMVQHLGIAYVAAPALIATTPTWMLRPLLLGGGRARVSRVLLHPVVGFVAFSFFFSAWHVPAIYEGALRNPTLHHAEHVVFLMTSLMMWWPIMSRLEALPRLPHILRLVYLFLLPVVQIPAFGAIAFADHVLYPTYGNAIWTLGMHPHSEQVLAGAVMKTGGLLAFGIPFAVIFFRWYAEESGPQGPPRVTPPEATPAGDPA